MKVSCLRSPLLMGCLLLSLASQGLCEGRRVMMAPVINIQPYYINDKGKYSGIWIDILRLIAVKLNWAVEFLECPSMKRCYFLAAEGNLDIGADNVIEEGYRDYLYYLQPPIETTLSTLVFYIKNDAVNILKYDDLSGLTVGTLIGGNYFELFSSDSSIHKIAVPDHIQRFKMLEAGRIDAFVGKEVLVDGYLNRSRFKDLFKKADYRVEKKAAAYIMIPKKSSFAKDRFKIEAVLKQLVESGKVREIYKQYGVELPPPTQKAPQ